ncbi:hypothetical protein [Pseudomonas sp. C5pp]|uniref:hypothetical protein n=1 Tax=Pseudomonas sp. C5pp TaxID=1586081 RepID=UPI000580318E|nr:hypothetical protein [Pseudomonas sp. C5pp]KIC79783.1 hypothetical protein RR51_24650 [Pseudomonas sp. C5pp]
MRLLLEEAQSDLIEMSFLISARLLIEGEADGAAVLTAVVQRLDVNQSDEATASLDVTPLKLIVLVPQQATRFLDGDRFDCRRAIFLQGDFEYLQSLLHVERALHKLSELGMQAERRQVCAVFADDPDVTTADRSSLGEVIQVILVKVLFVGGVPR